MTHAFLFTIATMVAAEPAQVKRAHFDVACADDAEAKALLDVASQGLKERGWQVTFDLGQVRCFLEERRRARDLLKRAQAGFASMLFAEAERDLDVVLEIYDKTESTLGAIDLLVEAHMMLGWISIDDDLPAAREHLRMAAALAPDLVLDKTIYPPTVVDAFNGARLALAGRSGRVNLESDPAGATVLLDGRERCRTPCALEDIPEGTHFLEVRLGDHVTDYRLFSVARASEQHLGVTLNKLEPRRLKSAVIAALGSNEDGTVINGTVTGTATSSREELALEVSDRQASANKLVGSMERANVVVVPPPPPAFYEKWWFWTAVAAGTTAIVVGAVVLSGGDTARLVVLPP